MERRFALPVLAALALTAFFGSLTLPAAGDEPKPGTITTVAGTGSPGYSGDNSPATQAQLNHPLGLALDAAGNLFIALGNFDALNHRVRKVSPEGTITTVAGTGKPGFSGDGGQATDAQLDRPFAVVVDGAGNLFIAEVNNHRVRKVTPDGIITTCAGSGPVDANTNPMADPVKGGFAGDNGPATAARLNFPSGLAVDAHDNLFIADGLEYRVRKVDAVTGIITTVAGNGKTMYAGDGGLATETGLSGFFVAIDPVGNLLISDFDDARVLKVFGVAAPGLLAGIPFPR
jgi:hypothetical protein